MEENTENRLFILFLEVEIWAFSRPCSDCARFERIKLQTPDEISDFFPGLVARSLSGCFRFARQGVV